LNVMSKLLNIGLTEQEVIAASTWKPAQVINREELGNLDVGAEADIAILRLVTGDFGYIDTKGWRFKGDKKLICEMTMRNGAVVWDLNGMSRPFWER